MNRFVQCTRGVLAGVALAGAAAQQAPAQFVAATNYRNPAPAQPGYAPYAAYGYPRVAQAGELPAPAESVAPAPQPAAAMPTHAPAPTPMYAAPMGASVMGSSSVTPYDGGYSQPTMQTSYPASPEMAGCSTGNCGVPASAPAIDYSHSTGYEGSYAASGYHSAPACDVALPTAPRRQWFAGLYGLYLDRAGDSSKTAVAYLTDTAGFTAGNNYYPQSSDITLFTTQAETDATFGGEVRFGSTFGSDPCGCSQPFAWEVAYWGIDEDDSEAVLRLDGTVSPANTDRLYSLYRFQGLNTDLDGAGTTWSDRPIYVDNGLPADGDIYANDVRLLGVRVRQRFEVQNVELNFWRFGAPTIAPSFGTGFGGLGGGGYGAGAGGCYADGGCTSGSCGVGPGHGGGCAPARPPRRFFINGLAGVRYLRIDDDFGLDQQFTLVDVPPSGNAGNPPAGWPTGYESFPQDDRSVIFSDFDADNELVGFQLGCSMNWLVGCRWNLFADSNFGAYGNNAEVTKRIYGGGDSYVSFDNGGGPAVVTGSETNVAFVGELRAGVGYQLTCNARLTAAYRFLGIGGVALGAEEYQNTLWTSPEVASHIDTNNSIVLHGLQAGVEYKY